MPQLVVTIPDFNLQSKWQGVLIPPPEGPVFVEYTSTTAA